MITICRQCDDPVCQLTPRQLELLELLANYPGASNKYLARQMGVHVGTVKKHLSTIYRTLEVNTRSECLLKLLEEGLILH